MKPQLKLSAVIIGLLTGISPLQAQDLSETYELALQNAPTLKQAQATKSAIGESKDQSIARFLPNISATGASSANHLHNKKNNDFRGPAPNQEFWDNTFNVNLTQPLFHWDHWIQLSQSDNQIAQAEATYLAELQNLMVKTTEAYFNVLYAQDNLKYHQQYDSHVIYLLVQWFIVTVCYFIITYCSSDSKFTIHPLESIRSRCPFKTL